MRPTLTIVLVALLASVGAAQTASTPTGSTEPKTGRNDFDEKVTAGGGLGGVRSKTNTNRLYVGGFPRTALPGPHHPGPAEHPRRMPRGKLPPMKDPPRIADTPDILGVKADVDLIHRNKFDKDDPMTESDRAPLQVLEQPRRFDPSQVINCRPNPCGERGFSPMRERDQPVIVRTSEGLFTSDDLPRLTPRVARTPLAPKVVETAAEVAERSHAELGDAGLVGRRPDAAISQLQAYLTVYPDDFHAMRMLSLAMLANRNVSEAATIMGKAYAADPLLAKDAIDPVELGLDGAKVIAMVQAAQASASKTGANAWLMVLVLQQGQGQTNQALATLEKAKRMKLSPELADLFAASLAARVGERPSK